MYPTYSYYSYEEVCKTEPVPFPPQHQDRQPGFEYLMEPRPIFDNPDYMPAGKLAGKTAIITGGDSGIGRAVAVAFAKAGANTVIVYLDEEADALETLKQVENYNGRSHLTEIDLRYPQSAYEVAEQAMEVFGSIDILVNNCAVQFAQETILDISDEQLADTFVTNVFSYFYMTRACLPYMAEGASIINTTSVTAYEGAANLLDYSATKGAITSFTRSLSLNLVDSGIRVNGVAPGPIWTPLQPASYDAETVARLGRDTPMKRAGQPFELAPTYVYLASDDSRYVTGQVLHVNGGTIVGS